MFFVPESFLMYVCILQVLRTNKARKWDGESFIYVNRSCEMNRSCKMNHSCEMNRSCEIAAVDVFHDVSVVYSKWLPNYDLL